MKCRKVVKNEKTKSYDISFFNSVGLGKAKQYYVYAQNSKGEYEYFEVAMPSNDDLPNYYELINDVYVKTKDVTIFKSKKPSESSASSYVSDSTEAIANDLIVKLSIIKGELWYRVDYGLPLFDKNKAKIILDASIVDIVLHQKGVAAINSINSSIENHKYYINLEIKTIYNETITVSTSI